MFKRLLDKLYSKPFLLVTNTVTGVVSISIGDVLQQNLEHAWAGHQEKSESQKVSTSELVWDSKRTKNMMAAGVYFSLFGHWWYSFLDKRFPPRSRNAVRHKLLAEMAMGPPLVSSVFFIFGTFKGQGVDKSWQYLKSNFALICSVEWLVFIPLQWFNFTFVPMQFRYLYVATVSICYDAFLSYILHRNERYQQKKSISESS